MDWIIADKDMTENLIMIMNRSLIPIEFSFAYILTVNLDSFVKVGSEFYSYGIKLIVLRNIRIHVFLSYLRCRIRHIVYFNLCKKIENNKPVDRRRNSSISKFSTCDAYRRNARTLEAMIVLCEIAYHLNKEGSISLVYVCCVAYLIIYFYNIIHNIARFHAV